MLGLAVAIFGSLAFAGASSADFPTFSHAYTQRTGGDCQNDGSDPVDALYYDHGGATNATTVTANATGWNHNSGDPQWLSVHAANGGYNCHLMDYQNASAGDLHITRYHIRIWGIPGSPPDNHKSVGDAHHERIVPEDGCGDSVYPNGHSADGSGFDEGREELGRQFIADGFRVTEDIWGNTANFKQCDGQFAGSNGVGVQIQLPI